MKNNMLFKYEEYQDYERELIKIREEYKRNILSINDTNRVFKAIGALEAVVRILDIKNTVVHEMEIDEQLSGVPKGPQLGY